MEIIVLITIAMIILYKTGIGSVIVENIKSSLSYQGQGPVNNANNCCSNQDKPEDKPNYQLYDDLTDELIKYNKGITTKIRAGILSSDHTLDKLYRSTIYDITTLVKRDYPLSLWKFGILNIGYYIRCSSTVPIKITTYDGIETEEIIVMSENHEVVNFKSTLIKIKVDEKIKKNESDKVSKVTQEQYEVKVEEDNHTEVNNQDENEDSDNNTNKENELVETDPEKKEENVPIKVVNVEALSNDWLDENFTKLEKLYQESIARSNNVLLIPISDLPVYEDVQLEIVKKLSIDRGFTSTKLNEKGIEIYLDIDIDMDMDTEMSIQNSDEISEEEFYDSNK